MKHHLALAGSASVAALALSFPTWLSQNPASPRVQVLDRLAELDQAFAGGPGGDFDWHVPANTRLVLDTTAGTIRGGPGGALLTEQRITDGIVHVRDLRVGEGATIAATGNRPLVIFASGSVEIDGDISVDGENATSVWSLCQPESPWPGASGNAGGGSGGMGSPETTQTSLRGESGQGAFGVLGQGGQGGETGWHPTNVSFGVNRRAAGGGGGVFARDVHAAAGCLDQTVIGLDAEDGFPGAVTANAALRPGELMPWGGRRGRSPFVDDDPRNDFYGLMIANAGTPGETPVQGELPHLWAGAGGGGGGDSVRTDVFPPPTLVPCDHTRGCGGGGGAGGLMILARGDIVFGPGGRISANGGHGNGGENTNFVNRVGGGSGGGSGGHVVLQSLGRIVLTELSPGTPAITALGGQGGEGHVSGAFGTGGANDNGQTSPTIDAKHVGVSGPGDLGDNPWIPPVPFACQSGQGVVRAAGGDGGPGVIQLHVRSLDRILPPGGDPAAIGSVVRPAPIGYAPPGATTQTFVHLMVPTL